MQNQSQKTFVCNLTKDGIFYLQENSQSEIYLQIIKCEELKRQKESTAKNKYFKYFYYFNENSMNLPYLVLL